MSPVGGPSTAGFPVGAGVVSGAGVTLGAGVASGAGVTLGARVASGSGAALGAGVPSGFGVGCCYAAPQTVQWPSSSRCAVSGIAAPASNSVPQTAQTVSPV